MVELSFVDIYLSNSIQGSADNAMSQVVQHLVLLKLRSTVTAEEVQALKDNLLGMVGRIEGVLWVDFGAQQCMYPSYSDRSSGYTHALVVTLRDSKTLEAYDSHPEHVRVKSQHIAPLLDKTTDKPILALDWITKTNPLFTQNNWNLGVVSAILAIGGIVVIRSML